MFKYWPAAILGLYIMLMMLLTVSLVMAYSDGIKITQLFQVTDSGRVITVDSPEIEKLEPVVLKEVTEIREIEVKEVEDSNETIPLPARNPVIKRVRVEKPTKLVVRKTDTKRKSYSRKKKKRACHQTFLDKVAGTCYDNRGVVYKRGAY